MLYDLVDSGAASVIGAAIILAAHFAAGFWGGLRGAAIALAVGALVPWLVYLGVVVAVYADPAPSEGDLWAVGAGFWMVGVSGSLVWATMGGVGSAVGLVARALVRRNEKPPARPACD